MTTMKTNQLKHTNNECDFCDDDDVIELNTGLNANLFAEFASNNDTVSPVTDVKTTTTKTNKNTTTIKSKNAVNFTDFMKNHQIHKKSTPQTTTNTVITNTRIGDTDSDIWGGTYSIPDDEYATFLELYYHHVFIKGNKEYLTEKQLENDGAILIDVDLRFNMSTTTRQYSNEHIDDLLLLYLEKIKQIYEFDDDTKFNIFVFEKNDIKRDEKKGVVKDGIHIIIGLPTANHEMQLWLRKEIVNSIEEIWGDFPIINTWDEVFDEGISKGHCNWQLYGSGKPNCETYKITKMYEVGYSGEDGDFTGMNAPVKFDLKSIFPKLSARNRDLPQMFYKNSFMEKLQQSIDNGEISSCNKKQKPNANNADVAGQPHPTIMLNNQILMPSFVLNVRTIEQLTMMMNEYLDVLNDTIGGAFLELKEAYDYCMILPEIYYTDYSKWIRVGWALRNINDALFLVWVVFSSQSATKFNISDIPDLYEQWQKFDLNNPNGLTKRSIMHWANVDAHDKYDKVRKGSIDYYVEQTIMVSKKAVSEDRKVDKGCGDFDIACVLHQLFKDNFVCVSVKSNIWYQYTKHRWEEVDSGTSLRMAISKELRNIYQDKMRALIRQIALHPEGSEERKILDFKSSKIGEICIRLARTNDKKNIMTEAKELFYDARFLERLDTNPYLLCFNNGVVDFKEKIFRKGYPDDYISKTTNINYVDMTTLNTMNTHRKIVAEIEDFMHKLFPVKELHDYMWEHLASTLIGTSSNQTFNMYIGVGQNGKSVLVSLMEAVLGQYKGDVPLSLVTDKRIKIGGLAPEIVALKGIRYAVMQEPSKGDRINEGIMKQLTSGIDPVQARAPYMPQSITFIPQFKLVVCSNEFMEIKSQDHGTWRRIRVVDFLSLFVEKPVDNDPDKPYQFLLDKNIKEKFAQWKEIFAGMLVKKAFETNGNVKDCNMVLQSSNEYRQNQDYIAEFIADKLIAYPSGHITKSEITQEFNTWYHGIYGKNCPNPKDVHTYMDKRFGAFKLHKCWKGVSINYDMKVEDNVCDDEGGDEGVMVKDDFDLSKL